MVGIKAKSLDRAGICDMDVEGVFQHSGLDSAATI